MKIIGCDFHPGYQQIAVLDLATGEMVEKALSHERKEEVRAFYAGLEGPARVGIEASGQSQWFERMLAEVGGSRNFLFQDLQDFGGVAPGRLTHEQMDVLGHNHVTDQREFPPDANTGAGSTWSPRNSWSSTFTN